MKTLSSKRFRGRESVMMAMAGLCISAADSVVAEIIFRPELDIARIYDSNVFFTAENDGSRKGDVLTRVSPTLNAEMDSRTLKLTGRMGLEAEEYNEFETLSSAHNRRFGGFGLEYLVDEKLSFMAATDYTETMTPGEFNLNSGLEPGRVNASRLTISPTVNYRFTPRLEGTLGVRLVRDRLEDGVEGKTREANVEIEQTIGDRNLFSYGYRYRHYRFSRSGSKAVSHLPKLGWTHQMSARSSIALEGGPRLSGSSADPYLSLSLLHEYNNGSVDISYGLDEVALIGEAGRFETQAASMGITHRLGPDLELELTPSYGKVKGNSSVADVFKVDLGMNYRINTFLSFVASYNYYDFQGSGFGSDLERTLSRNIFLMGIQMTYPGRPR